LEKETDAAVNPAQLIARKRDGDSLTPDEIREFVDGYAREAVPDYQMSAMAMAIYFSGMTVAETAALTHAALESGTRLDWPDDGILRADKHSTGGIGDKVSLVLAPLLACCGVQVPMLSGRGLGPTGGTLDKLESIPGFRTDLSLNEIQSLTQSVGCVITGASSELAPVDRRLYGLRDVTATIPSIPLITASIMSKKLAETPGALVLDVKFGNGAFMQTKEKATQLAHSLVRTGQQMGVQTTAILTDMNQPLGCMCGNVNEVNEAIAALKGNGESDLVDLTIKLATELVPGTPDSNPDSIRTMLLEHLDSGAAFEVFEQMVAAQGGDLSKRCNTAMSHNVVAKTAGFIHSIDTQAIGYAIIGLGGGRRTMTDSVNHAVGIEMLVKVGDSVDARQPIAKVFSDRPEQAIAAVLNAIVIDEDQNMCPPLQLIHERIVS
jgi:pyrimidine-nucleoside phosphorylase